MSRKFTSQENGVTVHLEVPADAPRYSADGFGPAFFGFPNTTLSVYQNQLSDPSTSDMDRKVVAYFTLPTVTILELAANIKKTMLENTEAIDNALDQMKRVAHGNI